MGIRKRKNIVAPFLIFLVLTLSFSTVFLTYNPQVRATVYLEDDFETSGTSPFDGTYTTTNEAIDMYNSGNPYEQSYSMKADLVDGADQYSMAYEAISGTTFYIRGYFYFTDDPDTDTEDLRVLSFGQGDSYEALAYCGVYQDSGSDYWFVRSMNGASFSNALGNATFAEDTWYCIEFAMYHHGSSGWVRMWVDGVLEVERTSQDTDNRALNYAWFGFAFSDTPTGGATVYCDLAVISDSYVGPIESEEEEESWLSGWDYRQSHLIQNLTGVGTDALVEFDVFAETGISSSNTAYLQGLANKNFSDVRFTDDDGSTLLDYKLDWSQGLDVVVSDGVSQPFHPIVFPSAYEYGDAVYLGYQGNSADCDIYVTMYNITTSEWANPVYVADGPLTADSHGAVSMWVNSTGHIHITYGGHDTPLLHTVSTNPESISSWTGLSSIVNSATYQSSFYNSSSNEVWIIFREQIPANSTMRIVKSSDGGQSWGTEQTIINVQDESMESGGYYGGTYSVANQFTELDGHGVFPISSCFHNYSISTNQHQFYCYYNTTDSNLYNVTGHSQGSLVDFSEAWNNCLIIEDNSGYAMGTDGARIADDGTTFVCFNFYNASGIFNYWAKWTGSSWLLDGWLEVAGGNELFVHSSSDVEGYFVDADENVNRYDYNGTSWNFTYQIYDGSTHGSDRLVTSPTFIHNRKDSPYKMIMCESDYDDFSNFDLKIYVYAEKVTALVEVQDDLSSNNATIYMYYGNPSASYVGNPSLVSSSYSGVIEDFESGDIDLTEFDNYYNDDNTDCSTAQAYEGTYSGRFYRASTGSSGGRYSADGTFWDQDLDDTVRVYVYNDLTAGGHSEYFCRGGYIRFRVGWNVQGWLYITGDAGNQIVGDGSGWSNSTNLWLYYDVEMDYSTANFSISWHFASNDSLIWSFTNVGYWDIATSDAYYDIHFRHDSSTSGNFYWDVISSPIYEGGSESPNNLSWGLQEGSDQDEVLFVDKWFVRDPQVKVDVDGSGGYGFFDGFSYQKSFDQTNTTLTETNDPDSNEVTEYFTSVSSDVDSSSDKGTETDPSNAQDTVPDSDYMTLQEADQGGGGGWSDAFSDGFEDQTFDKWDGNGATNWLIGGAGSGSGGSADPHGGSYQAYTTSSATGDLWSDDIDCSSATEIYVSFWYRHDDTEPSDIYLYYYDGAIYNLITNLDLNSDDVWYQYTHNITSGYFVSDFHLYFLASMGNNENFWLDDVDIDIYSGSSDYELDFEYQWTSADYDESVEQVGIYVQTASQNGENLIAYEWDGASSWVSLGTISSDGWNYFTATELDSSTYTIRIIDSDQSNEGTQSSWSIDCIILYCYTSSDNYRLDIEEQWTGLTPNYENEQLCIYGGVWSSSEVLLVDVWDGDSWENVISDLQKNQWNNVSVSTYLTGYNFTIRFRDGTTSSDSVISSWAVDVALLHLWNVTVSGPFAYIVDFTQAVSFSGSVDTLADYDIEISQAVDYSSSLALLRASFVSFSQSVDVSGDLATEADYKNSFEQSVNPSLDLYPQTDYSIEVSQAVGFSTSLDLLRSIFVGFVQSIVGAFSLDTKTGYSNNFAQSISLGSDVSLLSSFGIGLSQSISSVYNLVTSWGSSVFLSQSVSGVFGFDVVGGYLAQLTQSITSGFSLFARTDYLISLVQSVTSSFNLDLVLIAQGIQAFFTDLSLSVSSVFNLDVIGGFLAQLSQAVGFNSSLNLLSGFNIFITQGISGVFGFDTLGGFFAQLSQAVGFGSVLDTLSGFNIFITQGISGVFNLDVVGGYLAQLSQSITSGFSMVTQTSYLIGLVQSISSTFNIDLVYIAQGALAYFADLSLSFSSVFNVNVFVGYLAQLTQSISTVFSLNTLGNFRILITQGLSAIFSFDTVWNANVFLSQAVSWLGSVSTQGGFFAQLSQAIISSLGLTTQTNYIIGLIQAVSSGFNAEIIKIGRTLIAYFADLSLSFSGVFNLDTISGFFIQLSQAITGSFSLFARTDYLISLVQSVSGVFNLDTISGFFIQLTQSISTSLGLTTQTSYLIEFLEDIGLSLNLDSLSSFNVLSGLSVSVSFISEVFLNLPLDYFIDLSLSVSTLLGTSLVSALSSIPVLNIVVELSWVFFDGFILVPPSLDEAFGIAILALILAIGAIGLYMHKREKEN